MISWCQGYKKFNTTPAQCSGQSKECFLASIWALSEARDWPYFYIPCSGNGKCPLHGSSLDDSVIRSLSGKVWKGDPDHGVSVSSFLFWKLLCSKSQSVRSSRTQPLLTWATSISLSLPLKAPFQVSRCNFSAPIFKFLSFYIKVFVNAFISNLESLFHILPQFIVGSNKAGSWFFFLVLSSFSCSCLWTDSLLPSLIQSFCLWKKQRAKLIILLGS